MFRGLKILFKLDADAGSGYEGKLDDIAGEILIMAYPTSALISQV
jgi:uncharacterized protein YihD (DUF1040 family)